MPRRERGFSLVELTATLVVLAIVAAFAVPAMFDRAPFAARGYAADVAGAARLARRIAVASGCPTRLTIDARGYRAAQPPRSGRHCRLTGNAYPSTVRRADGTTLSATVPASVITRGTAQWTFQPDGSATIRGERALSIGASTLSVDAASGRVTGP